jgi:hypothetical protein
MGKRSGLRTSSLVRMLVLLLPNPAAQLRPGPAEGLREMEGMGRGDERPEP